MRKPTGALKSKVGLKVLSNLANQALERQLANEELRALLIATDLAESHCAWAVAMGLCNKSGQCPSLKANLLDPARGRRGLARGLGGQLLSRRLASRRLARRLLRASHVSNGKAKKIQAPPSLPQTIS